MTYIQFQYLSQGIYLISGIASLLAVVKLVQVLSPRQLPSRRIQFRQLAVWALIASIPLSAHYLYAEWYFWPDKWQKQREQAKRSPRIPLVDHGDVVEPTEITTIDGERIVIGGNETIVVLNFFATWS
jgi:hypothetical protein